MHFTFCHVCNLLGERTAIKNLVFITHWNETLSVCDVLFRHSSHSSLHVHSTQLSLKGTYFEKLPFSACVYTFWGCGVDQLRHSENTTQSVSFGFLPIPWNVIQQAVQIWHPFLHEEQSLWGWYSSMWGSPRSAREKHLSERAPFFLTNTGPASIMWKWAELRNTSVSEDRRAEWIEFIFEDNIHATGRRNLFVFPNHHLTDYLTNPDQYNAGLATKLILKLRSIPTVRGKSAHEGNVSI